MVDFRQLQIVALGLCFAGIAFSCGWCQYGSTALHTSSLMSLHHTEFSLDHNSCGSKPPTMMWFPLPADPRSPDAGQIACLGYVSIKIPRQSPAFHKFTNSLLYTFSFYGPLLRRGVHSFLDKLISFISVTSLSRALPHPRDSVPFRDSGVKANRYRRPGTRRFIEGPTLP